MKQQKGLDAQSKYERYYNSIIQEIINARMHFKLYKCLQESGKDYLKELNQAPGFFNFTIKAHLDAGLMHMFKVFKRQKDSITIEEFLDFVESNLELFSTEAFSKREAGSSYKKQIKNHCPVTPQDVKNDRYKLDGFKQVIKNLMTWRDKKYAHIDKKFALGQIDISKDFPIKLTELEDITTNVADILNRYSRAYDSSTYIVDMVGTYGVDIVLGAIRLRLEEHRKQLEELKKGYSLKLKT